ncbi:MAG: tRNA lysidine(34) synthetase TilS [candidate division Zixibacteria bacterium]|nr:tRNA lysidine(34) synthetase TilS [candidate division Zixibacteria bacterium]
MSASFENIVDTTLWRFRMLDPSDHVVVAVSGGPDSVALLHVLWHLSERWPFRLTVAHLNHGLRGAEADEDAAFVQQLADSLHLSCVVEQADVATYCRARGLSTETGAREIRYAFLERMAQKHDARKIATGHTADDQAETVLMRLLRGSGPGGLAGIRPALEGRIIRPLLYATREQVMAYLAARRLTARQDATNDDPDMLRNRVRGHLMPVLRSRYNPEIRSALCHLAEIVRAESEYMDKQTETIFKKAVHASGPLIWRIDPVVWSGMALPLQRRLLRHLATEAGANAEQFPFDSIEEARRLIDVGQPGHLRSLPGGLTMERRRETVVVRRGRRESWRIPMPAPGTTPLPQTGRSLTLRFISPAEITGSDTPNCVYFDAETAGNVFEARSRRQGDRMAPSGMTGTKSLKTFFNEWDIPRLERDLVPVLCSEAGILWVVGRRRCRWAEVTDRTVRVLVAKCE